MQFIGFLFALIAVLGLSTAPIEYLEHPFVKVMCFFLVILGYIGFTMMFSGVKIPLPQ